MRPAPPELSRFLQPPRRKAAGPNWRVDGMTGATKPGATGLRFGLWREWPVRLTDLLPDHVAA